MSTCKHGILITTHSKVFVWLKFVPMRFFNNFKILFSQTKKNMISQKVYVYGTLKKGEPNHHWLESSENGSAVFLSVGKTVNKYPLVIASKYNIPFLLYSAGKGENIVGEVYEIDEKMLSKLDILEDHPSFYIRELDKIEINENGRTSIVECWVYFLKNFKPELLQEEFLVEYHSEGPHQKPYTPAKMRDPSYHARVDVLQI